MKVTSQTWSPVCFTPTFCPAKTRGVVHPGRLLHLERLVRAHRVVAFPEGNEARPSFPEPTSQGGLALS